ncbi:MAG: helix-turn-helix transcriptional regulator [Lachnospiraceae bacterium]|nr:helix-turn-helix transcriptional regulator [Lachnospiraceae bacterium]
MDNTLISERLQAVRENLGINKSEAAKKIGLSNIGYCRYEYGERTPSPQMLTLIAQRLNTSVEYLTGETEDISPNTIVVSKSDQPALFELVNTCNYNEALAKRLLAYFHKIKNLSSLE